MQIRTLVAVAALAATFMTVPRLQAAETGSVIFFHPDGAGLNHWGAVRFLKVGPDGRLNWDRLEGMAVYTGHMKDALTSTSHGGATVHSYGVKVQSDSYGRDGNDQIIAASGAKLSLMQEAQANGLAIGVIQTGHIAEPGTGAFLASVEQRSQRYEIARQVIASGAQVIMAGGEKYLRPKGVEGRHGTGKRADGIDLIEQAKSNGYIIVYTREELLALDLAKTQKLLGVFAHDNTYNDKPEQVNLRAGKPHYAKDAPTIAEMAQAALTILSRSPTGFFLVAEEEGTDNLANANNASGTLEALSRADDAVGVFQDFVTANPKTLLIMAADSDAGGMQVVSPGKRRGAGGRTSLPRVGGAIFKAGQAMPPTLYNGAPLDGRYGTVSEPFLSAPDKAGRRWPFGIAWSSIVDVSGGILVRGAGFNADRIQGTMDNTDVYKLMYLTLFGRQLD